MTFMPGLWAASLTSFTLNTAGGLGTANCAIQLQTDFTPGTATLNGCRETLDGTTSIENAQFHVYCDGEKVLPSGQNECANIRHVCCTIPLAGTSCVEVQLIQDNAPCSIPNICTGGDCLECAQDVGSNLPVAFSFTGAS